MLFLGGCYITLSHLGIFACDLLRQSAPCVRLCYSTLTLRSVHLGCKIKHVITRLNYIIIMIIIIIMIVIIMIMIVVIVIVIVIIIIIIVTFIFIFI
jgi:hypothetical protein